MKEISKGFSTRVPAASIFQAKNELGHELALPQHSGVSIPQCRPRWPKCFRNFLHSLLLNKFGIALTHILLEIAPQLARDMSFPASFRHPPKQHFWKVVEACWQPLELLDLPGVSHKQMLRPRGRAASARPETFARGRKASSTLT